MVNLVQSLKVGDTSYTIKDSNTIPGLTADQKSVLLASGTYLDKAVVDGKVFETDAGKFERFNKTVAGSSFNWTYLQNPLNSGTCVAYGKGTYVVAGSAGIAYSKDGTSWTNANISADPQDYSGDKYLAYGNGVFVGVTQSVGKSLYSEDGINWETFNMPNTRHWTDVSYVNDRFMAVANNSNRIAYSFNGKDWTEVSAPDKIYSGITYGNGKYVAVGRRFYAYSSDGINWSWEDMPTYPYCSAIAYGNGIFVVTNEYSSNNYVMTSTDGVTWTQQAGVMPFNALWRSVIFTGEIFVAVGSNGSAAPGAYSYDGINWVAAPMPYNGDWKDVANADGKAVAVKTTGEVALGAIETQYSYSTTPLSYTAAEVDAKLADKAGALDPEQTINITLPSSGNSITATASGYLTINKKTTSGGQYISIASSSGLVDQQISYSSGQNLVVQLPVTVNDVISVDYNAGGTTNYCKIVPYK